LNTYYKIIKQKNYLLKKERDVKLLKEQLQAWNQQLSEAGCKIIKNRGIFTENLNRHSQLIFQKIFKGGFFLDLHYMPLGQKDIDQALKLFPEILESKMQTEIEKKSVLIGPHRDDLLINLNGKEAKQYASQGQQRAIVLSLKLAEMEIIINEKGDCPILLLDDVLSELDEYRRDYLIDYINCTEKQTILTMTAVDNKITAKNKTVYNVNQGTIRREG
jgi:DNA replication and repair protein RecF